MRMSKFKLWQNFYFGVNYSFKKDSEIIHMSLQIFVTLYLKPNFIGVNWPPLYRQHD